jgi:hypothetical protein
MSRILCAAPKLEEKTAIFTQRPDGDPSCNSTFRTGQSEYILKAVGIPPCEWKHRNQKAAVFRMAQSGATSFSPKNWQGIIHHKRIGNDVALRSKQWLFRRATVRNP